MADPFFDNFLQQNPAQAPAATNTSNSASSNNDPYFQKFLADTAPGKVETAPAATPAPVIANTPLRTQIGNALDTFTPFGPNTLAGMGEGAENFVKNTANLVHDTTGMGTPVINNIAQFPGVDRNSLAYKMGQGTGQYVLPAIATDGLSLGGDLLENLPTLKNVLSGATTGFSGTEGGAGSRSEGAALNAIAGLVPAGVSAVEKGINILSGKTLQNATEQTIGDLSGTGQILKPDAAQMQTGEMTKGSYDYQLNQNQKGYGSLRGNLIDRRYAPQGSKPPSENPLDVYNRSVTLETSPEDIQDTQANFADPANWQKNVNLIPGAPKSSATDISGMSFTPKSPINSNSLETPQYLGAPPLYDSNKLIFMNKNTDLESDLSSIKNIPGLADELAGTKTYKGAIDNYLDSPTYDNAHTLQSMLGSEAANFNSGLVSPADAANSTKLYNLKYDLQNNIVKTLKDNGDSDLAAQYQALGQNFKNNVQPYRNYPSLWNFIQDPNTYGPPNMLKELADGSGDSQVILSHLGDDAKNALVAQQLTSNYKPSKGVEPDKVVANALNMPTNLSSLVTDSAQSKLDNLNALNNQYQNWRPSTKNFIAKTSAAGGIASALGMPFLLYKHFFGDNKSENDLANQGGYYGSNNL